MTRIELNIADELASKAQAAGLLEQARLEELLGAELRRQAGERLRQHMAKLHAVPGEPMPMDEITAIVKEVRRERREHEARR
jgi:hypothetical protein